MTLTADAPAGVPTPAAVMARAQSENFPVASRLLPRRARADLLAIYGFARLTDELGDCTGTPGTGRDAPGAPGAPERAHPAGARQDKLAALDWLEAELDRAFAGNARHPLLIALAPTLARCSLTREPFVRLIEANRTDQRVSSYDSWEQLRGYCALSADPVGELVLAVLGLATAQRIAYSDSICTGLQLTEHCQDVAEDFANGRVYLPREDLERFGAAPADLGARSASAPLREVLAFEVARARGLFDEGAPLLEELRGRPRLAVAAFLAGGRAALDAIERAGYDVLAGPPPVSGGRRLLALLGTLRQAASGRS